MGGFIIPVKDRFDQAPLNPAHEDQKQHKIFSTLPLQSLKSPSPEGCDNLSRSDCGHLWMPLSAQWAVRGVLPLASFGHSQDLHGLAKRVEMMKSHQGIPPLCLGEADGGDKETP